MPMSAAEALFASMCEAIAVSPSAMLHALSPNCVNTSLSGTLFF